MFLLVAALLVRDEDYLISRHFATQLRGSFFATRCASPADLARVHDVPADTHAYEAHGGGKLPALDHVRSPVTVEATYDLGGGVAGLEGLDDELG